MKDGLTYRACPACDGAEATRLEAYSTPDWSIGKCASCGFVYLQNPPDYEALEEDFAWEKTYVKKREATPGSTVFSPLQRKVRTKTRLFSRDRSQKMRGWFKDGHVLDIGCGAGGRIPEPMVPYGIELSRDLHAKADATMRARGGSCVFGPGAEAIWEFEEAQFDGIVMNSYLEHEVAAKRVLEGAYRCLKPDGAIYVRVPNFGSLNRKVIGKTWCGFRHPDHVNYFTLSSLRTMVEEAGFTLSLVNPMTLPIDDNINALLRKRDHKGTT